MKDIKVGIVGLGRLGSVHAQNLAFKIPGCKLVAACSLEQKELDWAKDCRRRVRPGGAAPFSAPAERGTRTELSFPRRPSTAG